MREILIQAGNWGFFIAQPLPGIEQHTKPFQWVYLPGLFIEKVQFVEAEIVSSSEQRAKHLIVLAESATAKLFTQTFCQELTTKIVQRYPGILVSFSLRAEVGQEVVVSIHDAGEVAAVMAVAKVVGSWDESDPILILVEHQLWEVSVEREVEQLWRATVRLAP